MAFMPPIGPGGPLGPFNPFGPPGQQGQGPQFPMGPPGQPGMQQGAPTAPPPQFTPQQPASAGPGLFAVDPGAISGCLFRNTYVWLNNGQGFWFFPVFIGRTSTAGFRWTGRNWIYTGIDLRQISSFSCF